jgi:hypothetical protein
MANNVEILRGSEQGKDVYVIGSGKSIDYIPDGFWENKIVIGVNTVPLRVKCKYIISHHYFVLKPFFNNGLIVVTSEREMCIFSKTHHSAMFDGDYYVYKHLEQQFTEIDLSVFDTPNYLIAGGTIITTAIHFAYLLGAKNIVLSGVDGGMIDDEINYNGYKFPTPTNHMVAVNEQLELIVNEIRKRGVSVTSINPFINFNLEGHRFENSLLDS